MKPFKHKGKTYRLVDELLTLSLQVKQHNGRYKHVMRVLTKEQAFEWLKKGTFTFEGIAISK
jgi:hypothetical protein